MDARRARKRNNDGEYEKEYSDEELVEAVERLKIASTGEVAEEVGGHQDQTRTRLKQLAEEGRIERKDCKRRLVWYSMKCEPA